MSITLLPGELKQVDVSLTPVSIPVAVVMQGVRLQDKTPTPDVELGDPAIAPVTAPLGHLLHPRPRGINNTDTEVMFNLHCWCQAPNGKKVGECINFFYNKSHDAGVAPGQEFGVGGDDFVVDETGVWHYIEKIEFIPESPVVPVVEGNWPIEVV